MMQSEESRTAFFARIAAGATHEIRNVLAIIKESSGLIDDLIHASKRGKKLDDDKVLKASGRVQTQVLRGTDLIASLNRLAHSLDRTDGGLDVQEQLRHFDTLNQRFARQKNCQLATRVGEGTLNVSLQSFELQMTLSSTLEHVIQHLAGGGTINVGVEPQSEQPCIAFVLEAAQPDASAALDDSSASWKELSEGLAGMGVGVEADGANGAIRLRLPGATG